MTKFNTRQQYNAITKLISDIFDIKLEKVRHKVSQKEGFKNSNSHLAILPEEESKSETASNQLFNPEELDEKYLLETVTFEIYKVFKNKKVSTLEITAPRCVKLMYEGLIFTSDYWLSKKIYVSFDDYVRRSDDFYIDGWNIIYSMDENDVDEDFKGDIQSYHLGFVQNVVNKDAIVKSEKLLMSDKKLMTDLICGGSIEQFNYLCRNNFHKSEYNFYLGKKYLNIINMFLNQEQDECEDSELFYLIHNENIDYNQEKAISSLLTLEVPDLEVLTSELDKYCIEGCLVSHLLEGAFPVAGDSLVDTPFSDLANSIFQKNSLKDSILTNEEAAFMRHVNLGVKYLAKLICHDTEREFAVVDFVNCLNNCCQFLDMENQLITNALLKVPNSNNINLDTLNGNDEYKWENLPVIYWLVSNVVLSGLLDSKKDKKEDLDINLLFKNLNQELLDYEIKQHYLHDSYDIFNEYPEFNSTKTIREMLVFYLKIKNKK